jgi:hypothetical protein
MRFWASKATLPPKKKNPDAFQSSRTWE